MLINRTPETVHPTALHGVRLKPASAEAIFYPNLVVYGAGELLAPFIGIKLIDLALSVPS